MKKVPEAQLPARAIIPVGELRHGYLVEVQAVAAVRGQAGIARTSRLEAIETAIRQGTFRPDPARIAQQILQDAELSAVLLALLNK